MYEKEEKIYGAMPGESSRGMIISDSPLSVGLSIKSDNVQKTREICAELISISERLGISIDYGKEEGMEKGVKDNSFITRDEEIYRDQQELLDYISYLTKRLSEFSII
jgi:hypothetical protein